MSVFIWYHRKACMSIPVFLAQGLALHRQDCHHVNSSPLPNKKINLYMSDEHTPTKEHGSQDHNNGHDRDDHDDRRESPGQIIHPRPTHGEPAVRGRFAKHVDAMHEKFPQFTYHESLCNSGVLGTWSGRVQPIQNQEGINLLLDDLFHNRPVYRLGDSIQHLPNCNERHCEHAWMNRDLNLERQFDLQITYTGDKALPRCYVLAPLIPLGKRKHTWADGAICAFLDSEGVWQRRVHTVADFLPHALIWLVKWMVFDATEVWIGAEHNSSPSYHLQVVDRNDPCWCGSGELYRKCHRTQDQVDTGLAVPKRLLRPSAVQTLRWFRNH